MTHFHIINGNKLDNRIENLEVQTRAEHIDHHREELQNGQLEQKVKDL